MTPRIKAYLYIGITVIIWGFAGPVIKLLLNAGLAADLFLLYRFMFSAIAAIVIYAFLGFKMPKGRKEWILISSYAFLNTTISLGLSFWGISRTSLLDVSLLSLFGPLMTIILGYLYLKDHITHTEKIGTAIALIGSIVIVLEPIIEHGKPDGNLLGNILILASIVTGAISGLFSKELLREGWRPIDLTNFSFIIGFITMIPIVLVLHPVGEIVSTFTSGNGFFFAGLLYISIVSGTISYIIGNIALRTIELSETALFGYISPILSAFLAIILLGDVLTTPVVFGSLLTLIGVIFAEKKGKFLSFRK